MLEGYNKLEKDKFKLFLLGSDLCKNIPENKVDFISEDAWAFIYSEIAGISKFFEDNKLLESFLNKPEDWRELIETYECNNLELP